MDSQTIDTFTTVEYDPNAIDPVSLETVIDYSFFNRILKLNYFTVPEDPVQLGKYEQHILKAAEPGRDSTRYEKYIGDFRGERWYAESDGKLMRLSGSPSDEILNDTRPHESNHQYERRLSRKKHPDTIFHYLCDRDPNGNVAVHNGSVWETWRILSNRRATGIMLDILNVNMRLKSLNQEDLQTIDFSDESSWILWAEVRIDTLQDKKYKRLTVKHEYDDTVCTTLRKSDTSGWVLVAAEGFPKSDITKSDEYRLWIGREAPDSEEGLPAAKTNQKSSRSKFQSNTSGGQSKGSLSYHNVSSTHDWRRWFNTVCLEDIKNKKKYQIVESENLPRDNTISEEDALKATFGSGAATWKVADVIMETERQKVVLLACVSEDNLIVDRLVAKRFPVRKNLDLPSIQARYPRFSEEQARRYQHDKHKADFRKEVDVHALLSREVDSFVIRLRGASSRSSAGSALGDRFIAFLEYAEGGDLHDLIAMSNRQIPEVFLWILFRNLVKACETVEKVGFLHPDMKPANIFLRGSPHKDDYRAYPSPVLADFGLLFNKDIGVSSSFGTQGFYAPEQLRVGNGIDSSQAFESGDKLHVFSIGLNIWCVMRRRVGGLGRPAAEGQVQGPFIQSGTDPEASTSLYSAALEDLVGECMALEPKDRPTLARISVRIEKALQGWDARIPSLKRKLQDEMPTWERVHTREDPFAIGAPANGPIAERKRRRQVAVR